MRVLHYSLGFPPYRTGGMTKFCMDLMMRQAGQGCEVALLWPGRMGIASKRISVKDRGSVTVARGVPGIRSFELINPLPVSYDEGISRFSEFMKDGGNEAYAKLLEEYGPDVIHIHTLMGVHRSFLAEAAKKGIRVVFTAHDFFPICPKITLFRHGSVCADAQSCGECGMCNATALGIGKIRVLQSPAYRMLKDSALVRKIRKKHRDGYLGGDIPQGGAEPVGKPEDFKRLREYYHGFLKQMDRIHFNSTVTRDAYEEFFDLPQSVVIGITHGDIKDRRKIRHFPDTGLRIRYLGSCGAGKGFFLLREALDGLWGERRFCLDLHFAPAQMRPYFRVHERYTYDGLEAIFDETDVLVVPSVWKETFGYTALEALSFGVPVIISGTVGARDVLAPGAGIVIENITAGKLKDVLRSLDADRLREMNRAIVERQVILTLDEMAERIGRECYGWR